MQVLIKLDPNSAKNSTNHNKEIADKTTISYKYDIAYKLNKSQTLNKSFSKEKRLGKP